MLGHESLGRVLEDPSGRFKKGDLVAGIVRRPDPVPCPNCAVGEWDMCLNGQYTERGIKQIDGYMSELWRIEPDYAIKVDISLGFLGVLVERTSVVAKAWEAIRVVGQRTFWEPQSVLVTGAGPIGLFGALLGKQRGLDVHVLDRTESGPRAVASRLPDSSRTSSSNAPVLGRSSANPFSKWDRAKLFASWVSGAAVFPVRRPLPISQRKRFCEQGGYWQR